MFHWNHDQQLYVIEYDVHAPVVPAPPELTYEFLLSNRLISSDHTGTIGRALNWCRWNMSHFSGGTETDNVFNHWHYRGFPPISRVINGTKRRQDEISNGVQHYTKGCHGTVGFLRSVLRTINIPVDYTRAARHGLPHFMSINMYLSHGDDPYSAYNRTRDGFNAEELLIDEITYQDWFGPRIPENKVLENVGRRSIELAIHHLPEALLKHHCSDLAEGRSRKDGLVFGKNTDGGPNIFGAWMSRYYSMAELDQMKLWQRIDEKIKKLGGCKRITVPTSE